MNFVVEAGETRVDTRILEEIKDCSCIVGQMPVLLASQVLKDWQRSSASPQRPCAFEVIRLQP